MVKARSRASNKAKVSWGLNDATTGINSGEAGNHASLSTLFALWVQEGRGAGTPSEGSDMSAMDVHAEIPSAQNFHPEFGYLCPSPQMRRRVRSAALTVLSG